jgi:integrase
MPGRTGRRGHVGRNETAGTWYLMYDAPRGPDGRRRQIRRGGFRSRREADKALTKALNDRDNGLHVDGDRRTFRQFVERIYLPSQRRLRDTTRRRYTSILELHVLPRLGSLPLVEVRPHHIDALIDDLVAGGLSPRSVAHIHAVTRRVFRVALEMRLVTWTPVVGQHLPRVPPASTGSWSPSEARRFLASLGGAENECLFNLYLLTGVRRGEALGLRWVDTDLVAGTITVEQQLVEWGGRIEVSAPKTRRGARCVDLDVGLVALLRKTRLQQAQHKLRCGPDYLETDLVFTEPGGGPRRPSRVSRDWQVAQQGLELPRLRLHDARHTYASLMLEAGVPLEVVSRQLGHATLAFTMDTYGHVRRPVAKDAATRLARLIQQS